MMQRLANDPSFIAAIIALLSALAAYVKARSSEVEQKITEKTMERVTQATGTVAAQVNTHSAQIAALQATTSATGERGQATVTSVPVAVAPPMPAEQTAAPLPTVLAGDTNAPGSA